MNKGLVVLGCCILLTVSWTGKCYAGQWMYDDVKESVAAGVSSWWYKNEDSTYPVQSWKWIDGKCYFFNEEGWMLFNTVTPDGYYVGADGAWVSDIQKYMGADFGILDISYIKLTNKSHPSREASAIIYDEKEIEAIFKNIWNYKILKTSEMQRFPPGGYLEIIFHLKSGEELSLHEAKNIICADFSDGVEIYYEYEAAENHIDLYQFLLIQSDRV